jgi:hypothetical protein
MKIPFAAFPINDGVICSRSGNQEIIDDCLKNVTKPSITKKSINF